MVTVLTEPAYSGSIWCKELLKSLTYRLKQKRIPFKESFDSIETDSDSVFIIASDYNWIKNTISQLNHAEIKPILLCNQAEPVQGCDYSCVCSDINGSMKYLLDELKSVGKKRIALYGVNTSSISDIGRVDGLFTFKDESFDKIRIFTNSGSLKKCFDEFFKEYRNFDAVICSNDFAAVSLVRNLMKSKQSALDEIKILSCAQTRLSAYYRDTITSVNMNFEQYGKAAVFIYEKLKSHPYMSGITVSVKWNNDDKKSPRRKSVTLETTENDYRFYTDGEMRDMLTVEQALNICNNTDREILFSLMNGLTLEKTARRCFLTESGVKYRIKRILTECKLSDKTELLALLNNYLSGITPRIPEL